MDASAWPPEGSHGQCRLAHEFLAAHVVETAAQAAIDVGSRLEPQFALGAGDVSLAMPNVAGTRIAIARQNARAEEGVDPVDEFEQRGALAAGDVVDATAHARRIGGEQVGLHGVLDEGEVARLLAVAVDVWRTS